MKDRNPARRRGFNKRNNLPPPITNLEKAGRKEFSLLLDSTSF